jgi:N-acylneuraminate cytidylyltransferase
LHICKEKLLFIAIFTKKLGLLRFFLYLCAVIWIIMGKIKLFLTDVDGYLTDGGMYYTAEGDAMKRFCVYDGMGMALLRKAGVPCGILTSEQSPIVKARAEKLKLDYLYLGVGSQVNTGCLTKRQAAQEICDKLGISLAEVCYVGDDINDIDLLSAVGFPCCPPNARSEIKAIPNIRILTTPGGQGAIREICDEILALY